MNRQNYCMFVVLFFVVFARAAAAEHTYNILFIQSYTSQTPWHNDLNEGVAKGFKENGLTVNITTEYLDADFWLTVVVILIKRVNAAFTFLFLSYDGAAKLYNT